ncbi:MAG: hypothetical protein EOP49_11550, partial [Sphingobacteriales bacterium]
MNTKLNLKLAFFIAFIMAIATGCEKDPYDGVVSNEKSIEAFTLGTGFIQIGPAVVDRLARTVNVKVLMEANTDLSKVSPLVQASYKAKTSPASGEPVDFTADGNTLKYTVTSESGQSKEWTVTVEPFEETITGIYNITAQVVYGGTGPEWGGGGVINMTDKPWVWPADGSGPQAEMDNTLVFELTGATDNGDTYGKFVNNAGPDGKYASYLYTATPQTDVNSLYRTLPKGEGVWTRSYANNTVTFKFADGSTKVATFRTGAYTYTD